MDNFERSMELARQVGKLRGVIIGCLSAYGDTIPSAVCRNLQRVIDETESGPMGGVNDACSSKENIQEEVLDKELRERFPFNIEGPDMPLETSTSI